MTVCILVALRVLWRYFVRIFAKFQLPQESVESGRFAPEAGDSSGPIPQGDERVIGRCVPLSACALTCCAAFRP
jgi:hypothetical protein